MENEVRQELEQTLQGDDVGFSLPLLYHVSVFLRITHFSLLVFSWKLLLLMRWLLLKKIGKLFLMNLKLKVPTYWFSSLFNFNLSIMIYNSLFKSQLFLSVVACCYQSSEIGLVFPDLLLMLLI